MKKRVTDWDSMPLINYSNMTDDREIMKRLLDEMTPMHQKMRPSVDSHKRALGKQDYCWNGSQRFWVWEGANWRVFCNNVRGTSFEVREGITLEEAFAAWDDYRVKVGLKVVGG